MSDSRQPAGRESLTVTMQSALDAWRRGILMATLVSFFAAILTLSVPLYMLQVFDRVISSHSMETLALLTLMALVAIGAYAALDFLKNTILARVGYWIEARLSLALLEETMRRAAHLSASRSLRPLSHAATLRTFIANGALAGAIELLWTPLFVIFLFFAHYTFGLIALIGAVGHALLSLWSEAAARESAESARQLSKDAFRLADAGVTGAGSLAPIGMKASVLDRWTALQGGALQAQAQEAQKTALVAGVSRLFSLVLQLSVIAVGAVLISGQLLTVGVMIAASIIVRRAISPYERATSVWRSIVRVRKALDEMREFAAAQPADPPQRVGVRVQPSIVIDRATARYSGAAEKVFRHLSLEITPGDTLCIAGAPGSGKTTLARLLVGAMIPRSGRVLIGGIDTRHLDDDEIGCQIGYLPQDVGFCPGSIGQNIARLTKEDPARTREAARLAGIDEQIARLPRGYETDIEHPDSFMSTRFRRRIALARALYGDPELIVLDEPDPPVSRDDLRVWSLLINHLRRRGATIIVFTTSAELMVLTGKIMHLNDGRLGAAEEFSSKTITRLLERGCAIVSAPALRGALASQQGN